MILVTGLYFFTCKIKTTSALPKALYFYNKVESCTLTQNGFLLMLGKKTTKTIHSDEFMYPKM